MRYPNRQWVHWWIAGLKLAGWPSSYTKYLWIIGPRFAIRKKSLICVIHLNYLRANSRLAFYLSWAKLSKYLLRRSSICLDIGVLDLFAREGVIIDHDKIRIWPIITPSLAYLCIRPLVFLYLPTNFLVFRVFALRFVTRTNTTRSICHLMIWIRLV